LVEIKFIFWPNLFLILHFDKMVSCCFFKTLPVNTTNNAAAFCKHLAAASPDHSHVFRSVLCGNLQIKNKKRCKFFHQSVIKCV